MLLDAFSLVTESSHQTYLPPSPSFYGKNGSVGMVASTLLSVTFRCFTLPSGTIVPSYRLGTATKLRCWGNRYRKLGVGLIVTRGRSCDRHNQSVIPLVRFRRGCCRDHGQTPSRPEPLANTPINPWILFLAPCHTVTTIRCVCVCMGPTKIPILSPPSSQSVVVRWWFGAIPKVVQQYI